MLSYEDFVVLYPCYKGNGSGQGTAVSMVEAKLAEAALEIDATVWGPKTNTGHGLLTAIKLAKDPMGRNAKLTAVQGGTNWDTEYRRLLKQVTGKARPII